MSKGTTPVFAPLNTLGYFTDPAPVTHKDDLLTALIHEAGVPMAREDAAAIAAYVASKAQVVVTNYARPEDGASFTTTVIVLNGMVESP